MHTNPLITIHMVLSCQYTSDRGITVKGQCSAKMQDRWRSDCPLSIWCEISVFQIGDFQKFMRSVLQGCNNQLLFKVTFSRFLCSEEVQIFSNVFRNLNVNSKVLLEVSQWTEKYFFFSHVTYYFMTLNSDKLNRRSRPLRWLVMSNYESL